MTAHRLSAAVLTACLLAAGIGVHGWHQAVVVAAACLALVPSWPDLIDTEDLSPLATALEELP